MLGKPQTMDAILNQCFTENLFKMPALQGRRRTSKMKIPTVNKLKYTDDVVPILGNQRLAKNDMVSLDCRATHCIKPKSVYMKDCDTLYAIFASMIG